MIAAQPPNSRHNPYVGPRAYTARDPEEGRRLYGRDRDLLELLQLFLAERIVLLFSPSGAGKSSLLNAAFLPALRAEGFRVLPVVRVGHEPEQTADREAPGFNRYVFSALMSLEEGRPDSEQREQRELAGLNLPDYLDELAGHGDEEASEPLALIFDQFEEVLTLNPIDQEAKREFFAQLGEALRDRRRWALFAMREDYVAALDPFLRLLPTALANTFRLDLLGEKAARFAIRKPAADAGVNFTREAAESLVNDLRAVNVQQPDGRTEKRTGPHVDPVQLQVVCLRLWEKLPTGRAEINVEDLAQEGDDVNNALAGYFNDSVRAVAEKGYATERDLRRWMDQHLITKHGIRGQVLREHGQTQELDTRAIDELINLHLLRGETRRGSVWIELAHDRLIEPIRADNARYRKSLSGLQRRADEWQERGRPEWLLLRGDELFEASKWAEQHQSDVTQVETEYLKASRRRRGLILLFFLMFVGILGLGAFAGLQWYRAREAAGVAKMQADEALRLKGEAERLKGELEKFAGVTAREYWKSVGANVQATGQLNVEALNRSFEFNDEYSRLSSGKAPPSRQMTQVRYYPKLGDPPGVANELQAIRVLGFKIEERTPKNDLPINYVYYGSDVHVDDAKLLSLALLRAGVQLRVVSCFHDSMRKSNVIEIGAGTAYQTYDPVTVAHIRELKQCENGASTMPAPGDAAR